MSVQPVTEPLMLDSTGQRLINAINQIAQNMQPTEAAEVISRAISGFDTVEEALVYLNTQIALASSGNVKSVNGIEADENGAVRVDVVPYAEDIVTTDSQASNGEFIARTTGGEASLSDGTAKLDAIFGRREHIGYVAEVLNLTVNAVQRETNQETGEYDSAITAVIDRSEFLGYVNDSATITLSYTTAWSADPSLYGLTVTGTPVNGDAIIITYVKENLGTIVHSNPTAFVETGWNLYDHAHGYARVLKYSDNYGFKIGGTYTAVKFSATLDGEQTTIVPDASGLFTIASDGYVWVTGGNDTDTYILMTWSDWGSGYTGNFAAYSEDVLDLSAVMSARFPYGLMQVGNVYDSINVRMGVAYSRIERMANTVSNLAVARASGRAFEYDTNYIYIVKETADTFEVSLDGELDAYDHGMEIVRGTTVPVYVQTLYGKNLVDYLRHDIPDLFTQQAGLIAGNTAEILKLPYIADTTRGNRNAAFHNSIYRGKSLGTAITAAQFAQISAGTFDDMFIGDYWTIGGQDWVICDFDYYYRCGDSDISKHHIVLMPRSSMNIPAGTALYGMTETTLTLLDGESATSKKWNPTNSTAGGYKFSRMRQTIMRAANTIVIGLFGASHVEAIPVLYPNPSAATDSGLASGWAWFNGASGTDTEKSICDLLNETQVYGQQVWGQGSEFGNAGFEVGTDKFQLSIFALNRNFANIRAHWWLRSVWSATHAAYVGAGGYANNPSASYADGVRPRFLLV